jgi:hypothetical protein
VEAASDKLLACALTAVGRAIAAATAKETARDLVIDFINCIPKKWRYKDSLKNGFLSESFES